MVSSQFNLGRPFLLGGCDPLIPKKYQFRSTERFASAVMLEHENYALKLASHLRFCANGASSKALQGTPWLGLPQVVDMQLPLKRQDESKERESTKDDVPTVDLDIYTYHETNAGRLVLDPVEARKEFGAEISLKLKLTKDGKKVLWPQPTDDPNDPQNWSNAQKHLQLLIIFLAAIVPDFDSAIGIATVFTLAEEFHTTTQHINDLTSNWSLFLIGWGGLFFVMLMRKYGRLPILFWSQLLALGFLVGTAFAPNIRIFAAMRCLTGFFGTCPQVSINIWTMGVILAPHLSPFVFGFLVARINWRWAWWIGCLYGLVVLLLIVLFMKESMYRRGHMDDSEAPQETPEESKFKSRVWTLIGITGIRNVKPEPTWKEVLIAPIDVVWRPHMFLILLFEAVVFGFGIGINVTNTLFLQSPPPVGFGFDPTTVSAIYATPVVRPNPFE
ncbi:hypothetical protein NP233_g3222 [Leucocoprinus birnbaumii]|uniref:MFS general substrate transporter n=1 Tax=Leucocoprinus birnbaumii TaxID=56174 RepID=A0AAD5VWX5_9AGAR|nr:hypothetical protein NP233_g3222 [Leucocoprinus birnbaumii]